MWAKPKQLVQAPGTKHEGKWNEAAPVFDDSVSLGYSIYNAH